MCGLAGFLRTDRAPSLDELRAMSLALAHRGPDHEAAEVRGPLALAHRRLAILDLSPAGCQPMANEDGRVRVAYNGQLFGFEPLRARLEAAGHRFRSRTDTEVLVHLYEERGPDLVHDVDGMFAFALWDEERRRLVLARDRLGIKPLYYARTPHGLAFASELQALLALPWVPRRLDPLALVQYLYLSSVPGDRCIVEGVRKLPPAHRLVVDEQGVREERYWDLPDAAPEDPGFEATAAELGERLDGAVRSHLVADVPVGVFLSGGLDSSAVAWHARRHAQAPLHTFSVGFSTDPDLDESVAARATAAAVGSVHHEVRVEGQEAQLLEDAVRRCDEPLAVVSAVPLLALAREARREVKVVLTGDGADEVLAGYPWRHEPARTPLAAARRAGMAAWRAVRSARSGAAAPLARALRMRDGAERYAAALSAFIPEELETLLAPDLRPLARTAWGEHPVRRAYAAERRGDEVNRRLAVDVRTTLVDEMLTKADRMTMAAGLEARVPFLDRALVEWAFRRPGDHKVKGGTGKRVLRRHLADRLPAVARGRKRGFDPPLATWLRGPWRARAEEALSDGSVRARGLFQPEAVARLRRAHLEGRVDAGRRLYTLLALEIWLTGTGLGR